MMNVRDFTEEMRNEIVEAAKNSLMKLGIMADVAIILDDKHNRVEIDTASFNTTPVIYKSITVSGGARLSEVEDHDGVYDLNIHLDYWFKSFGGGSNGMSLGTLKFRVFENSGRVGFVGFFI